MGFYVANEEDGATVAGLYPFAPAFRDFKERVGESFEFFVELTAGHMKWLPNEEEYGRATKKIFERIVDDKAFFPLVKRKTLELSDEMRSFSRELLKKDLQRASTSELISLMRKQSAQISELLSWALLITVIELPHELVSKKLLEIVTEKIAEKTKKTAGGKTALSPADYAAVLSTPLEENNAKREFKELIEIACEIDASASAKQALLENKNDAANAFSALEKTAPALARKIGAHAQKFGWVYYGYAGPAWTADEFAREIAALLEDKNPRQAKAEMQARDAALARKQKEFEAALDLNAEEKRIAGIARDVMFLKAYRKEAMFYSYYAIERVQKEFGERCGLSLRQVRCLYPHDFEKTARREIKAPLLDSRFKYCVFGVQNEAGGRKEKKEIVFFDGADAEKQSRKFSEKAIGNAEEVRGACAQPGFAFGVVRIINKPEDIKKMLKGDVLVSIATTPDLVTAMRKASAIVTDIGGLTCHAAIVSRELGIPCVVGTRIATKVFRDGDNVEVDASNGIVRKPPKIA